MQESILNLPSFTVHMIIIFVDQIGYGNKSVSCLFQPGDQGIQGVCSIFGTVVAKDDGAVSQMLMAAYSFDDIVCSVILPIQAVYIPLDGVIAQFPRIGYDMIVIISVRRTE